jgi:aryl-alcohol dehydrogenase-like predicted oxidoreductase
MTVETTDLRPGHTISRVIRGGWQLAGDHGPVDRAQAIRDMEAFVDAGLFTFDCADIYTGVEEMIGDFIADLRQRRGASVADRVCIHTKLVPDLTRLGDLRADEVEAIIDRSLKRLKVDQLDLVQFFWWDLDLGNAVASLDVPLAPPTGTVRRCSALSMPGSTSPRHRSSILSSTAAPPMGWPTGPRRTT